MNTYMILGTTDDHTACELCGRDDLKATVALRNVDTGEVVHFGSDCAARAMGWTGAKVKKSVAAADHRRPMVELAATSFAPASVREAALARLETIARKNTATLARMGTAQGASFLDYQAQLAA